MPDLEEATTTGTVVSCNKQSSQDPVDGDQDMTHRDFTNKFAWETEADHCGTTGTTMTSGEVGKPDGTDKQTAHADSVNKTEAMSDLGEPGSVDLPPSKTDTTKSAFKSQPRGLYGRGRPKPPRSTVGSGGAASGLSAQPSAPCRTGNGVETKSAGD